MNPLAEDRGFNLDSYFEVVCNSCGKFTVNEKNVRKLEQTCEAT